MTDRIDARAAGMRPSDSKQQAGVAGSMHAHTRSFHLPFFALAIPRVEPRR